MLYKRGKVWWFKFRFNNQVIRESSKSPSKTVAKTLSGSGAANLNRRSTGFRSATGRRFLERPPRNGSRPRPG
jgi:hypothetical protein